MNTATARQAAIVRLKTLIQSAGSPAFDSVFVGEPTQIAERRTVHLWFDGEEAPPVGRMTFGNIMAVQRFIVRAYYQLPATIDDREAVELQLWNDCRDIQAAIRGDSTLGGNVTDLDLMLEGVGFEALDNDRQFRAATWTLRLDELEAEEITA